MNTKSNSAAGSSCQPRIVRWFLRQFDDYQWARRKLGGQWQRWVPEDGSNKGFWICGHIMPEELAYPARMKGQSRIYIPTVEVETYPANDERIRGEIKS
jgi:hypothetical protein